MALQYFTKRSNFWLYKVNEFSSYSGNLYRIGLTPESFQDKFDFESQHISHIYLDHRLKNYSLKKGVHFGTILYNNYSPLHLTTPFSGIITGYNHSLPYSYYFGYQLLDKDNWFIEMEIFEEDEGPFIETG